MEKKLVMALKRPLKALLVGFICMYSGLLQAQTTRYVKPVASGSGNGSSWANASKNLQAIINSSGPGDMIWVAGGDYQLAVFQFFSMKEGVLLYGGFNGTETALSQRNWIANEVKLIGNAADVIRNSNLTNASVLDGFTIFNAGNGSGIKNSSASPTISNCTFRANHADVFGGAMYNEASSPIVTDCSFTQNTAANGGAVANRNSSNGQFVRCTFTANISSNASSSVSLGGGMFNYISSPALINCTFTGNMSTATYGMGGGIYNTSANPQITNCSFTGNVATADGGGMHNENSSPTVTSCSFTQNSVNSPSALPFTYGGAGAYTTGGAPVFSFCSFTDNIAQPSPSASYGGGLFCMGSGITARNCRFSGNSADNGAGITAWTNDYSTFTNCLITGNKAIQSGGGILLAGTQPMLFNGCTIGGNSASIASGAALQISGGAAPTVTNSIFWDNNRSILGSANVQYSIVEAGFPGTGNIAVDPSFINAPPFFAAPFSVGDYRFQICSPAYNAGSNALVVAGNTTDLLGHPRIASAAVDMGAIEYTVIPAAGNKVYVNKYNIGNVAHTGNSWTDALTDLTAALRYAKENENLWSDWNPLNIYVATGTYIPGCGNDRNNTFVIGKNVTVYGGFDPANGISTLSDTRISGAAGTILSGDIGLPNNNSDNCYHVVSANGALGGGTRLDNITITGGNANGSGMQGYGGGVYDENSWLFLNNCTISGNFAQVGGGMYTAATSIPTVMNCVFNGNGAASYGGALDNAASDPYYRDIVFSNNYTTNVAGGGGAIVNLGVGMYMKDCSFTSNSSDYGGAIYNWPGIGSSELTRCAFSGNHAQFGGAMWNQSITTVESCSFSGNYAASYGGAVYNLVGAPEFTNCVFSGNSSINVGGGGGAMFNNGCTPIVKQSTFRGNTATFGGAIHNWTNGFSNVFNSVIWGNSSGVYSESTGGSSMGHCIIQGGHIGIGNINADPLFVNAALPAGADGVFGTADDGLHLQPCSPAINRGQTDIADVIPYDITSQVRVQLVDVDMGAYESNSDAGSLPLPFANATVTAMQASDRSTYYSLNCNVLLASITGDGTPSSINGNTTIKTWIESAQPAEYVKRHYEITPQANASSATGNVTLYFTQADFDAFNALSRVKLPQGFGDASGMANLLVEKRGGVSNNNTGLPESYTGSKVTINPDDANIVWNDPAARWEVTFAVAGFSGFFVKTSPFNLPLRLLSFTAVENNCMTKLQWITAEENNVSYYEVQQSTDGNTYNSVQQVTAVNSSGERKYGASIPVAGSTVYYRLKMTDRDGTTRYSQVVIVTAICASQVQLFPNPATEKVFIRNANFGSNYQVYDNAGRIVRSGRINNALQTIYIGDLTHGIYYVEISGAARQLKFVKQ